MCTRAMFEESVRACMRAALHKMMCAESDYFIRRRIHCAGSTTHASPIIAQCDPLASPLTHRTHNLHEEISHYPAISHKVGDIAVS